MAGIFDPANMARFNESIGAQARLEAGLARIGEWTIAQLNATNTAFTNNIGHRHLHGASRAIAAAVAKHGLRASRVPLRRYPSPSSLNPLPCSVTHNLSKYCELYPLDRTFTGRIPAIPFLSTL